jgi:pimeloyl-ACP methyl ester carboxylesterase
MHDNPRKYGDPPFQIALVHGGPGAAGDLAPVARFLAKAQGILEPLQTGTSLEGQVTELKTLLENYGDLPMIVLGHSWGAWLSLILSARYPQLVQQLILVGSGPLKLSYVPDLESTRLSRLTETERNEYLALINRIRTNTGADQKRDFSRLGELAQKTDQFDPIVDTNQGTDVPINQNSALIFQNVWQDAAAYRRSGKLLADAAAIQCPVVAIHGDYDPHPAAGVKIPLASVLKSFRFILLAQCGHTPWLERQARERFYQILQHEISQTGR